MSTTADAIATEQDPSETKLRSDTRGRVRTPREQRERLLDELEGSGLSCLAFARLSGVKYPTLMNWVMKRRRARQQGEVVSAPPATTEDHGAAPAPAVRVRLFEALAEVNGGGGACLELELPGGARTRVETRQQAGLVAELLRALSSAGVGARLC